MGDRRLEGGATRGTVFDTCKFLTTSDQFLSILCVCQLSYSQLQLLIILPTCSCWIVADSYDISCCGLCGCGSRRYSIHCCGKRRVSTCYVCTYVLY